MTPPTTQASPRVYATVAGAAYLTIAIVALLYGMLVESQLIVPGDHVATAISILFPSHPQALELALYGGGELFELTFGFWLVFKGIDLARWNELTLGRPSP